MNLRFVKITYTKNIFNPDSIKYFSDILVENLHTIYENFYNITYNNFHSGESYSIIINVDEPKDLDKLDVEEIFTEITWVSYEVLSDLYKINKEPYLKDIIDAFEKMFPDIPNEDDDEVPDYIVKVEPLSNEEVEYLKLASFIDANNVSGVYH